METSVSKDEDRAGVSAFGLEPVAQCGPSNDLEKDDKRASHAEIEQVCSKLNTTEIITLEAASVHKGIDAGFQEQELENAEISLVIEVKTDAESGPESSKQEEEIMPGEAASLAKNGKDATLLDHTVKEMDAEESERSSPGVTSEVAHKHTEKSSVESVEQEDHLAIIDQQVSQERPLSSHMHETVEKEPKIAIIQTQVVKQEDTAVISSDEMKGLESKGGESYSVSEVPASAGSERLHTEEVLASTRGLELNPLNSLNLASGSVQGLHSEPAEMEVEADSVVMPSRKRAVDDHMQEQGLQSGELSGVLDIERKKARMASEESVDLAERCSVLLERQPDMLTCRKAGEVNIKQCIESSLGEVKTEITREQESGSILAQTEEKADKFDMESEGTQLGSIQSSEGTDRVQEGTWSGEGTAVLTEAVRGPDVIRDSGKLGNIVREGTIGSSQAPLCVIEAGSPVKAPDICFMSSYGIMESGTGLTIKQIVTEGKNYFQDNIGAADKDDIDTSKNHIEVHSSKHFMQAWQVGQESRRNESDMIGQNRRAASAVPGSLKYLGTNSVTVGNNQTDALQLERQQIEKVNSELRARLQAEVPHEVVEGASGRVSGDLSFSRSHEVKEEGRGSSMGQHFRVGIVMKVKTKADMPVEGKFGKHKDTIARDILEEHQAWNLQGTGYDNTVHQIARFGFEEERTGLSDEANTGTSEEERIFGSQRERGGTIQQATQKRKLSDNIVSDNGATIEPGQIDTVVKKAKKKAVNVWAKTTSRKGPKKNSKNGGSQNPSNENTVLLTPVYANPDKVEDGPDQPIVLSKYDKAEKIELSEDRLSASGTKGYRMVRATRGVQEGTWYYEILVEQLGPTGHTRLGWSTQKGDVQAPAGFDSNSYGYRDLDGSKTHVAIREPYGDLYVEGDVIGFYIHLPNGAEYAPKPAPLHSFRGRPYLSDVKEEQPKRVPGSEICFFRNGVCQGTAFRDIYGGRYFPAASMYTLPKEPSCVVRFNFGPDFRYPPVELDGRPSPTAMVHAPYHNALGGKEVPPVTYANVSATGLVTQGMDPQMKIV